MNKFIRRYRLVGAGRLLFLAALLALIGVTPAQAAEPFRIGLTLGLTGKYANPAAMQQRAFRLWESEINEKGGLLGRPVEVVIVDDESNPKKAPDLYRKLIAKDRVDLVFAPYSSAITATVAPVVDKLGYPTLAAGAASDKIWQQGYTNVFALLVPASRYSVGMLKLALLNDLKTVAIVYADDAFATSAAQGAKRWAPKLGLDVVMFEAFKKGTRDLSHLARKARDGGASLVVVAGHFNESVDMREALKRIGWYPKAFFATVGPVLPKYYETLGADANLTFASSLWEPHEAINFPRSKEFTAAFRERYDLSPSYHAANAYAAGQILEAAVKLSGSLKRDKLRQAFYDLDTYIVVGRYVVDRTGVQVKRFSLVIQWQNGKKEIVWPEEVRSAPPLFK